MQATYSRTRAREGMHLQHQLMAAARQMGNVVVGAESMKIGGYWRIVLTGDYRGFPDYHIFHDGRLLVRELKLGENTTLSEEQERWLERYRRAGVDADVWRGSRINEILEEIR